MRFSICVALLIGNIVGHRDFIMRAEFNHKRLFKNYFRKSVSHVKLECALLCVQSSNCEDFSFDPGKDICYQYTTTPKDSDASIPTDYSLIHYSTVKKNCPSPYTYLSSWKRCVFISTDTKTFGDALTDCQSDGGHLIYVQTLADQNLIKSLLDGGEAQHFVGGRNGITFMNESFYWLDVGSAVRMWASGEPDGGLDKCVVISPKDSFLHRDVKCNVWRKYICEIFVWRE